MPFVELTRYSEEDDSPTDQKVYINPVFVSFIIQTREDNRTFVRGPDGRGFVVTGSYEEIKRKLEHPGPSLVN